MMRVARFFRTPAVCLALFVASLMLAACSGSPELDDSTEEALSGGSSCGDYVCDYDRETPLTCRQDCCPGIYKWKYHEDMCKLLGWKVRTVYVGGVPRRLMWKGPRTWKNGAIITLHGGGGMHTYSCYNDFKIAGVEVGKAAAEFGNLAVRQGFAVFSLDSGYNMATGEPSPGSGGIGKRPGLGKRFDFLETKDRDNVDLPLIKKVISGVIPFLRPRGSAKEVFITGISTGGFTTVLAATHFDDRIAAFAPVNSGDPYGANAYPQEYPEGKIERQCVPGVVRDRATNRLINEVNACRSAWGYPNEKKWATTHPLRKPAFRVFHHKTDGMCEISCTKKVRNLLILHGYREDRSGPFKLSHSKIDVLRGEAIYDPPTPGVSAYWPQKYDDHMWQEQYNQPLLDFFKKHVKRPSSGDEQLP